LSKKRENSFPLKDIIDNSKQLFGVSKIVVEGALYRKDPIETITVSDAKELIEEFLKREVK
jgi:hypothetical protein